MSFDATRWAWKAPLKTVKISNGMSVRVSTLRLVLLAYAERANQKAGYLAWGSSKELSEMTGLDRKYIIGATMALEQLGHLFDTGDRKGKTNSVRVYRVVVPKEVHLDIEAVPKQVLLSSTQTGTVQKLSSTCLGHLAVPKEVLLKEEAVPVCHGSSTQTGTSIQERTKKKRNQEYNLEEITLPDWLNKEAWGEWIQHRKELRKPVTKLSAKKAFKVLDQFRDRQQEIIDTSIQAGYQGLFPPKGKLIKQEEPTHAYFD